MKVDELMIGDWVIVHARIDRTAKIETVDLHSVKTSIGGPWIFDEIDPIPLTPEILEKNGWKHKYYGIYRQTIGETITIDIFPEGCSVEDDRGSPNLYRLRYHLPALKFVHELQHALRLCGIEKEITLN